MQIEPPQAPNQLPSNNLETEAQPLAPPECDERGPVPNQPIAPQPALSVQPAPRERSDTPACRETLTASPTINRQLSTVDCPTLAPEPASYQLATIDHQLPPAVIEAKPLPPTIQRNKARRRGRIACLPKPQRDMVNRMLVNGVPYRNIVAALSDAGFNVTERNVSNWATGGHLEWQFEQDLVLQNRLDQDHLVDHLRRDDASELPEVGLQAAATRLSQILLQKTARADQVEANLGTFSQMVDVLCRLNKEISTLQKQRDESRRSLGRAYDPARIREEDQTGAIEDERFYSDPPSDSTLSKPAEPPLLPPVPTSSLLADADREAEEARRAESEIRLWNTVKAFSRKNAPASTDPKLLPPTQPQQ